MSFARITLAVAIGMLLPCAASAASADPAKPPTLMGNPGPWFGADAYPPEALRAEQQGRVIVTLTVDATGKPVSCAIEKSAAPALDRATCDIALAHAMFRPASDQRGKAIFGTFTLPVRWLLPGGDPFADFVTTLVTRLAPDGTIVSCRLETSGAIHDDHAADPCRNLNPQTPTAVLGPFAGKAAIVWMRRALTTGEPRAGNVAREIPGDFLAKRQRARITLAPDGSISSCALIEDTGPLKTADICTLEQPFQPASPGDTKPRTGIVELALTAAAATDDAPSAPIRR